MEEPIPNGFSLSLGAPRTSSGFSNRRAKKIIEELREKQRERLQIDEIDHMSLRVVLADLRKRAKDDDSARVLLKEAEVLMEPDLPL